jgi:hypothetical protein
MKVKNVFLSTLIIIFSNYFSFAQQKDSSLANAFKRINKLGFLWNRPLNSYEVTFIFKNTIQYVNCLSPQQIIDNSVKNATTEAKKLGKTYDAIIIGTSGTDTAIVFSDKTKDNSLCKVQKSNGKFLIVECKPAMNYDIVDKIDVAYDKENCPTHLEHIEKLFKKAEKSKKDYDALVYGISGSILIKFRK